MSDTTSFDYSGPISKRAIQILRALQSLRLSSAGDLSEGQGAALGSQSSGLSKRATQILRGLQGMRLSNANEPVADQSGVPPVHAQGGADFAALAADEQSFKADARAEPSLESAVIGSQDVATSKTRRRTVKLTNRFSRNLYLADTRSSYLATLIFAVVVLLVLLGSGFSSIFGVVLPRLNAASAELQKLKDLPNQLQQLKTDIQQKNNELARAKTSVTQVRSGLADADDTLTAFSMFIARLAEEKVQLLSQKDTVSQAVGPHPLLQVAAAPSLPPKPGAPAAAPTPAPAAARVNAKLVPGINVRHIEVSLQGNYMGYLAARQTLLTLLPNAVVHKESLTVQAGDQSTLAIRLFISLPFEHRER